MSKIKNNQFLESALAQIPRLLCQLNRNPSSRSYGSFDRAFWHYRTNDISCGRYQEVIYTLALLYASEFEGNTYYRDEKLLEWIHAGLRFTTTIQRGNGSFDEWYINEDSYVTTAFLTAALSETVLLLREKKIVIEPEMEASVLLMLGRAAGFLSGAEENTVMNQVSGAVFAIAAVGSLSGRQDLTSCAHRLMNNFLAEQNPEGWWKEYGGPDIGYLTLTINYLEKYADLFGKSGGDEVKKVAAAIAKAKSFVELFINPDMTAGGEYMSRNTEYIVPSKSLPYCGTIGPAELDDRYLCYILYNWIKTGLQTGPKSSQYQLGERFFEHSGLLRVVTNEYFLVANGKKGGSLRVYGAEGVYYDSGLEIVTKDASFSTGILDEQSSVKAGQGMLMAIGSAKKIKEPLLDTKTSIIFKTWQLVFARIPFLRKSIKSFLRRMMISYAGTSPFQYERRIKYAADRIVVTDIVRGIGPEDRLLFGLKSAYNAVPSSKYMIGQAVSRRTLMPVVEEKRTGDTYSITRTFVFTRNS